MGGGAERETQEHSFLKGSLQVKGATKWNISSVIIFRWPPFSKFLNVASRWGQFFIGRAYATLDEQKREIQFACLCLHINFRYIKSYARRVLSFWYFSNNQNNLCAPAAVLITSCSLSNRQPDTSLAVCSHTIEKAETYSRLGASKACAPSRYIIFYSIRTGGWLSNK